MGLHANRMRYLKRRRRRRTRGAAYTEAVIMLPVFFIILWGYHLLYNGHVARGNAQADARMSAWETSMEGCGLLDPRNFSGGDGGIYGDLSSSLPWLGSILNGVFGPLVGGAMEESYSAGFVPEEGLLAGGSVTSRMRVVCNTRRASIWQILRRALCESSPLRVVTRFMPGIC